MEQRPDGRKYSRVARRSVAIISNTPADRGFTVYELADYTHSLELPEFYLKRFERQMSAVRMRDYVEYLVDLGVMEQREGKWVRTFARRSSDGEWAQSLSDLALSHLAAMLHRSPGMTPGLLQDEIIKFFADHRVPTLSAVIRELGIQGGRAEEAFKWSLYLYADGEACPFEIRRYPTISRRAIEEGE